MITAANGTMTTVSLFPKRSVKMKTMKSFGSVLDAKQVQRVWSVITYTIVHMYLLLTIHLCSDSSPKDDTLSAPGTQSVAIETKLKGRNPSPQEHDEGTTKRTLRKKPSQSSPSGGKFH